MVAGRHVSLLAQQQQHELDSSVLTRIVHRHCLTRSQLRLASGMETAGRRRRWCWWLAGVVSGGTATSVVLVAGHHHQGCLLRSGPWSLNLLWSRVAPLILLSQRQSCQWCGGVVQGQDTGNGVNKVETTAGVWQQSRFTCSAADSFQHT